MRISYSEKYGTSLSTLYGKILRSLYSHSLQYLLLMISYMNKFICFLRFPETLEQIELVLRVLRYNPDSFRFHGVVLRIKEGMLTSSYKDSSFEVSQSPVSFVAFNSFASP